MGLIKAKGLGAAESLVDIESKMLAARGGQMYADEPLTAAQMRGTIRQAAGALFQQFAPAGKGQGAFLRGKLMGSAFLTGVSPSGAMAEALTDPNVVGIPRRYAAQMLGQMTEMAGRGMYDVAAVEEMGARLMAGETVGGFMARHPFIGAFSLQPTKFQVMNVEEPVMAISKQLARVTFADPEFGAKTLNLSPLVGLAGDKDADIFSAMLVSPDLEKKISKQVLQEGSEYTSQYMQHQARMGLIKAKGLGAAESLVDIESKMLADVQKLGTVQRWVPRLSVELTQARQAALGNLRGAQLANAQFLLEWLEQVPISAKHLSPEAVAGGRLRASLQSISAALRATDVTAGTQQLTRQIEDIVKGDALASRLLRGNLKLADSTELEKFAGRSLGGEIRGIDIEGTARRVLESLQGFRESGEQQFMTHMAARGRPPPVKGLTDLLARMKGPARGAFSEVSSAVQGAANMISGVGRTAIRNYKPLTLGLAGSLAVAAVLSSPSDTIGPGRNLANIEPKMNVGKAASTPYAAQEH
jgi:hypothetical protein